MILVSSLIPFVLSLAPINFGTAELGTPGWSTNLAHNESYQTPWIGDSSATLVADDDKVWTVDLTAQVASATLGTFKHGFQVSDGYYNVTVYVTCGGEGGDTLISGGGYHFGFTEQASPNQSFLVPHNEQGGLRTFHLSMPVHSSVLNDTNFGVTLICSCYTDNPGSVYIDRVSVALSKVE